VVGDGGGGGSSSTSSSSGSSSSSSSSYGVVVMVVVTDGCWLKVVFLDSRCVTVGTLIFGLTDRREGCGGCVAMLR
jgi:hypothetical protein